MIYGFSCLKQFSGALVISGRGQISLTLGDFKCQMNPWQYCDNYVAIMWQHCENFVDILKRNSDNFWKTRIIATTILILDFFSLLTILTWMQNTNQKLCISGTGIKVVFFKVYGPQAWSETIDFDRPLFMTVYFQEPSLLGPSIFISFSSLSLG